MTNSLQQYMVPETMWQDIEGEILQLRARIANNEELQPNDVVRVQNLVKQVDTFGKDYTRALNGVSKQYKSFLSTKLKELHYDEIQNYVANKKREQDLEINNRLNEKIAKMREIIENELALHPIISSTGLKETMVNLFQGRFPKVSSGAKSSEIKNWKPIESVVKVQMDKVEELLQLNPTILYLPIHSATFQALASYFRSGDINILTTIPDVLKNDADLLRNIMIKQQMNSEDDLLNLITGVMNSSEDSTTKLSQIKQLIFIWETL